MYKLYANDFISCQYCNKLVNLYYCKQHLNTKRCQILQELLNKDDYDNLYLKFIREINKLKSELRLKED